MLQKSVASFFILVILLSSCKSTSLAVDNNPERYFFVIAKNRPGITGDLVNACADLEVTNADIITPIENGPDFFGRAAYYSNELICLRLTLKPSNDQAIAKAKTAIRNIQEVISINSN